MIDGRRDQSCAQPRRRPGGGARPRSRGGGAEWIGVADAFWWRDVWLLLGAVASATERIELGPAMTNPYMRHRFHTASALATLQEKAHGRVFCGIAAGGSELTAAAAISRRDAAAKVTELVTFLREVAASGTLDAASGRGLDVDLDPVPILMAGRGDKMLHTAGAMADRVLLWAIPASDLERSASIVHDGATHRPRPPELVWAPLVRHGNAPQASILYVAVYASLNTAAAVRQVWGLDDARVEAVRKELVRGDVSAAAALVPPAALEDLVFEDPDPAPIAAIARRLGVSSLAVPGFDPDNGRRPRRLGQLGRGPTRLSTAEPTGRDKRPRASFRPVGCWRRRVQPSNSTGRSSVTHAPLRRRSSWDRSRVIRASPRSPASRLTLAKPTRRLGGRSWAEPGTLA